MHWVIGPAARPRVPISEAFSPVTRAPASPGALSCVPQVSRAAASESSPKRKSGAPEPTHLIDVFNIACIGRRLLPAANANTTRGPPATGTDVTAVVAIAAAITISATITPSASATPAAAASAPLRLRRRRGGADQDGRGACDIDEQQSDCCEATSQDIVAFSHSEDLQSLPTSELMLTVSLGRATPASGSSMLRQYFH